MAESSKLPEDDLLEIGSIGKAHGLRGEVSVTLSTNVTERLAPGAVFQTDRGPLTVSTVRPHQQRHLVSFEDVTDRSAAESLRELVLRAAAIESEPAEGYWIHELIGASVREAEGTERGTIVSVEANPASDLLVLDSGALVPVTFVVAVTDGVVEIDPPPGLFDL